MKKLLLAAFLVLASAGAQADPPQPFIDANNWIAVMIAVPAEQAACRALTWRYALHSYSGAPQVLMDCATIK